MILSRPKTLTCALWSFQILRAALPHMSLAVITVAWPFSPKYFSQGRAIRSKVRLPSAGTQYLLHVSQSKTVLMNWTGFQAVDSRFQVLDSGSFVSGTWIPGFNPQWDSGFLWLYSRFQSPGFQIPQAKISPNPETGLPYIGRRDSVKRSGFFFSFPLTWLDDRFVVSLVIDVLQNGVNSSTILDETSRRESAPTVPPKTYPMNKKRHSIHDIPDSAPPLPPRSPVSPRSSLFFSGMFIIIIFLFQIL